MNLCMPCKLRPALSLQAKELHLSLMPLVMLPGSLARNGDVARKGGAAFMTMLQVRSVAHTRLAQSAASW